MSSRSPKAVELQQGRGALLPQVTFARRTSFGRYLNYSREDLDSEIGSTEFINCTVQIPQTPDNQPMDPSISQRVEEQYVSNSIFTGGFNSATRAHLMDKVIDTETSHPQMAGAKGSLCKVPGCDGTVMSDERGVDILPCECDFKICRDCYMDAVISKDEDSSDDNRAGVTGAELKIPAAIISPYRLFALISFVVLGLFLHLESYSP